MTTPSVIVPRPTGAQRPVKRPAARALEDATRRAVQRTPADDLGKALVDPDEERRSTLRKAAA